MLELASCGATCCKHPELLSLLLLASPDLLRPEKKENKQSPTKWVEFWTSYFLSSSLLPWNMYIISFTVLVSSFGCKGFPREVINKAIFIHILSTVLPMENWVETFPTFKMPIRSNFGFQVPPCDPCPQKGLPRPNLGNILQCPSVCT